VDSIKGKFGFVFERHVNVGFFSRAEVGPKFHATICFLVIECA
jgi:hypothetical protein